MGPEHVPLPYLGEVAYLSVKFCVFLMGPGHVPLPYLGEVAYLNVKLYVFSNGPRTRPATLSRGGYLSKLQIQFFKCAPNTSRYPIPGTPDADGRTK